MSPAALTNALLHDRGVADEVDLPVQFRFDGSHRVRLRAVAPAVLEATCVLDCVLTAADPALQKNLLRWNLEAGVVGPGSLGVDGSGERVVLRLALPTDGLSVEAFKAELHAFLERVERLEAVLVNRPLDYEAAIPEASPPSEEPPPPSAGAGFISV
jgi:hypothetical protein